MGNKVVPNELQLFKLAAEAVRNAANKQSVAATMLAAGGSAPEAFSLAALGLEELGKAVLCSALLTMPPAVRSEVDPWMLDRHLDKLAAAYFTIRLFVDEIDLPQDVDAFFAQIAQASADASDVKLRGLYVDAADDGTSIKTPDTSESDARALVELVGRAGDVLKSHHLVLDGSEDPTDFLAWIGQMHQNTDYAAIGQQADANPMALLQEFRTAVLNDWPLPAWLLSALPEGTI